MRKTAYFLIPIAAVVLFVSCTPGSDIEQQEGNVIVQIPVQNSFSYELQKVQLVGIDNLKKVSGSFAKFFYAPGMEGNALVGGSPRARFVKSGNFFVPADIISTHMASLYYHMQNMAALDEKVGALGINVWPRAIGLETQMADQDRSSNNAFYDGQSDSMMFVPFTGTELPIALNAGIIAHEHFHSLFFKTVIKAAVANEKLFSNSSFLTKSVHKFEHEVIGIPKVIKQYSLPEKKRIMYFNEAYLRGLNEGIADFWGWVYTEDVDFMNWSLPRHTADRTLRLESSNTGIYCTERVINNVIAEISQINENPEASIATFAYKIGTPHARFLKQWVSLKAEQDNISIAEAKIAVAQGVFRYLKKLQHDVAAMEENQLLEPDSLFRFFANEVKDDDKLTENACDFLKEYLNFGKGDSEKQSQCEKLNGSSIVLKLK